MPHATGRDPRNRLLRTKPTRSDPLQLHLTQRSTASANFARLIPDLGIGFCVTGLAFLEFASDQLRRPCSALAFSGFSLEAPLGFLRSRTNMPVGTTASTYFRRLRQVTTLLEQTAGFRIRCDQTRRAKSAGCRGFDDLGSLEIAVSSKVFCAQHSAQSKKSRRKLLGPTP